MTKILLVEDDKSLREIYGVRLLAEGYDIVSAGDGEEALAMAIKERPQLIVSDVMMPKISGFDMLDILRSTTETKDIKVIMMTALSSEDQRARGEALGADRYLVKSQVGIEDVVRTVHDVLGDALVTSPSAAQTFGGLGVSTAPRQAPAMPARPLSGPQPSAPAPQPQTQAPQQQSAPAQPTSPGAQQPAAPSIQRPVAPPQQSATSTLPQPTAPFSTARPANLGERVIHPVAPHPFAAPKQDLGSLIDQELGKLGPQPSAPAPQPQTQAPQQQSAPAQPTSPGATSPAQSPASPVLQNSSISFEETPRPPAPPTPPSPFGPQPPASNT